MNLQQLEYIIAVENHRHFAKAAEACFVTQPTLSTMIQKLEDELGVRLFDRSKQPVVPTPIGECMIAQARRILAEAEKLKQMAMEEKGVIAGTLRLGIIPTLAPYLLPLFLKSFTTKYPGVTLKLTEMVTDQIVDELKRGKIDAGLLVTPLYDNSLKERPLFYEEFYAYVGKDEQIFSKEYILPGDINPNRLWLLEEGHCFRSQILKLCELKKESSTSNFEYEAGSIETLIRLVEQSQGVTIIPELAIDGLTSNQQQYVRPFVAPAPVREVSIVTHREQVKKRLIDSLTNEIVASIPQHILKKKSDNIVDI